MNVSQFGMRLQSRWRRTLAGGCYRRPRDLRNPVPLISFSFDDFPRSALWAGGAILMREGLRGTYYASLGLMGTTAPTGAIAVPEDLAALLAQGHELGCHTFGHCHAWDTPRAAFEAAILRNREALAELAPQARFQSLSYPISCPRPSVKRCAGRYFPCSRGGGQTFNVGQADLNHLKAFFLEKCRGDLAPVRALVDQTVRSGGWLILATHDISETPTPYGCTPDYFAAVVQVAVASGARILPVAEALAYARGESIRAA